MNLRNFIWAYFGLSAHGAGELRNSLFKTHTALTNKRRVDEKPITTKSSWGESLEKTWVQKLSFSTPLFRRHLNWAFEQLKRIICCRYHKALSWKPPALDFFMTGGSYTSSLTWKWQGIHRKKLEIYLFSRCKMIQFLHIFTNIILIWWWELWIMLILFLSLLKKSVL